MKSVKEQRRLHPTGSFFLTLPVLFPACKISKGRYPPTQTGSHSAHIRKNSRKRQADSQQLRSLRSLPPPLISLFPYHCIYAAKALHTGIPVPIPRQKIRNLLPCLLSPNPDLHRLHRRSSLPDAISPDLYISVR